VEQRDVVRHTILALERLGIDYAVVGSLASMVYGEPRMTRDMDVFISGTRLVPERGRGRRYSRRRHAGLAADLVGFTAHPEDVILGKLIISKATLTSIYATSPECSGSAETKSTWSDSECGHPSSGLPSTYRSSLPEVCRSLVAVCVDVALRLCLKTRVTRRVSEGMSRYPVELQHSPRSRFGFPNKA
jgi:hypothetical protein